MARAPRLYRKSQLRRRDRTAGTAMAGRPPVPMGLGLVPGAPAPVTSSPLGLGLRDAPRTAMMGQGINPAAGRARGGPAVSDIGLGLGIGLLTGDNWGEGAGQGLLYAKQFSDQRADRERQARLDQMGEEEFQFRKDAAQREIDAANKSAAGYQMFLGRINDDDPSNDIPGLTKEHGMFMAGLTPEQGYDFASSYAFPAAEEPLSPIAKLKADLDAGRIDRATYDALVKKETYIKPEAGPGSFEVDINGDGVPEFTMGGGGISKEWQSKDNAFANRLDNAILDMDTAEAGGYDPTASSAGGLADYVGQRNIGGLVGNALTSDKGRNWYRGAKEALAVVLRKDTGAAITNQEFELYGPIYLPMPWDDTGTKASKKRALLTMRNSLRQGIGQTPVPQEGAPAPTPETAPTPPPAAADGIPTISTPAEASKLPKGSKFRDPNGVLRTVP